MLGFLNGFGLTNLYWLRIPLPAAPAWLLPVRPNTTPPSVDATMLFINPLLHTGIYGTDEGQEEQKKKKEKRKKFSPFLLVKFTANHMATNWKPPAQTTGTTSPFESCKSHYTTLCHTILYSTILIISYRIIPFICVYIWAYIYILLITGVSEM